MSRAEAIALLRAEAERIPPVANPVELANIAFAVNDSLKSIERMLARIDQLYLAPALEKDLPRPPPKPGTTL